MAVPIMARMRASVQSLSEGPAGLAVLIQFEHSGMGLIIELCAPRGATCNTS